MTSRDLDYGLECQDENGGCMCCSLLKCEDRDHESCGEITPKILELDWHPARKMAQEMKVLKQRNSSNKSKEKVKKSRFIGETQCKQ